MAIQKSFRGPNDISTGLNEIVRKIVAKKDVKTAAAEGASYKITYEDAQKQGFFKGASLVSRNIYKYSGSEIGKFIDSGSVWELTEASDGKKILVKMHDEAGNIVRKVKASLKKKSETDEEYFAKEEAQKKQDRESATLVETTIPPKLKSEVMGVVGGLYSMNAPHSIGYLFNSDDGKKISGGMFCDYEDEIYETKFGRYQYFFNYETKKFYEIAPNKKASLNKRGGQEISDKSKKVLQLLSDDGIDTDDASPNFVNQFAHEHGITDLTSEEVVDISDLYNEGEQYIFSSKKNIKKASYKITPCGNGSYNLIDEPTGKVLVKEESMTVVSNVLEQLGNEHTDFSEAGDVAKSIKNRSANIDPVKPVAKPLNMEMKEKEEKHTYKNPEKKKINPSGFDKHLDEVIKRDASFSKEAEADVYEADWDALRVVSSNDRQTNNRLMAAYKNLTKKKEKGIYDRELAAKLMMYIADEAAKKWYIEIKHWADDGNSIVVKPSMEVRRQLSKELVKDFEDAYERKDYDFMGGKAQDVDKETFASKDYSVVKTAEESVEEEADVEFDENYEPEEEIYEGIDEPVDGDYVVQPTGNLGEKVGVSIAGGKHLGDFIEENEAIEFIKEHMEKEQFWPNVWWVSDHGNVGLLTIASTKIAEEKPEEQTFATEEEASAWLNDQRKTNQLHDMDTVYKPTNKDGKVVLEKKES